ncbi:cytochrome c [Citrifermentans bemidjiense Bem]|uniref:Cytochrome c n=1 Tax=Citrifermentans bemidjiense (strain ATCC BAA-1014 / DSM 16622 / JCM 12645 / Bem) TaxID=404380 RepID=B5E892_CITBB|nr:cytochrome c [Citrifermentans bemidjiense]ACH40061.2 cytochrome c [Citrifermentans bemidjiense Bem]
MKRSQRLMGAVFTMLMSITSIALAGTVTFPKGAATPSETCGECHQTLYLEYALGVGSDNHSANRSIPAAVSSAATAHATSKFTPLASGGDIEWCRSCHFAGAFNIPGKDTLGKQLPNVVNAGEISITCATCHLTPEGKVRSVHKTKNAPHESVVEPALQTAAVCAHCHVDITEKRIVGGQYQTFLEWRDDFKKPGLGTQQCQDCHMPRTVRKTAEDSDAAPVAVGRHLWTGGHSSQRLGGALSLSIIQRDKEKAILSFSVTNIGAGHSVPTGPNARGVYLTVDILDRQGVSRARKEWLFAPNFSARPDDNAFLEEDKKLSGYEGYAQTRADAQGTHEPPVRAGEERLLNWEPALASGLYTVKAKLRYTTDRFKASLAVDEKEMGSSALLITNK